MQKCVIVIPCYNEAERILSDEFAAFVDENTNFSLLFVNDGSTDNTSKVLEKLSNYNTRINSISLPTNQGKAEAVRTGVLMALRTPETNYVAYLDADLAIPLEEFKRLFDITIANPNYQFTFLSKIPRKNAEVKQPFKRFFIGRVLAFMNKLSLRLPIYDTQCGCKLMTREIAEQTFISPFISSWLFDIEIFWRILNNKSRAYFTQHTLEVPLNKLIERGPSSISRKALFKLPLEFLKIHRTYNK
jgi:dolichyl-phosphate beta-glucosyltransferase